MKKVTINVSKHADDIRNACFKGKNGSYLTLVLWENKDGPDQYGNDGFVTIDLPKEQRDAGKKSPILGNWKDSNNQAPQQNAHNQAKSNGYQPQSDSDEIPF